MNVCLYNFLYMYVRSVCEHIMYVSMDVCMYKYVHVYICSVQNFAQMSSNLRENCNSNLKLGRNL